MNTINVTNQQGCNIFNTQKLTQSPTVELLLQCLKRPITEDQIQIARRLYNQKVTDFALWEIASEHKVASAVAEMLQICLPLKQLPEHWQTSYQRARIKISRYLNELERISADLIKLGVHVIVLENGALACLNPDSPARFSFGDFDLLVRPEQVSTVHRHLTAEGYIVQDSFLDPNIETPLTSDGRIVYEAELAGIEETLRLNIQTSLVARRWLESASAPTTITLFNRAVKLEDSSVLVLCPEDFLLQLCIHNAAHAYVRKPGLRLHVDLEWFVSSTMIDWPKFVDLVKFNHLKTQAYFSLLIPSSLFSTSIPSLVLDTLRPAAWKEGLLRRWIQEAGLFELHEEKFGRIKYILFTALLYDDFKGLLRGIFPEGKWMQEQYQFRSRLLLPYYHLHRLGNLLFRRLAT